MFIDLTLIGGVKTIRVRAEAIAYLDSMGTGANVKLIGGDTLRVNEDPVEIERLIVDPNSAAAPSLPAAPQGRKRKVVV